jgi:hypothetical protein
MRKYYFPVLFITIWASILSTASVFYALNSSLYQGNKALNGVEKVVNQFSQDVKATKDHDEKLEKILLQNQRLMKRSTAILENGCKP